MLRRLAQCAQLTHYKLNMQIPVFTSPVFQLSSSPFDRFSRKIMGGGKLAEIGDVQDCVDFVKLDYQNAVCEKFISLK